MLAAGTYYCLISHHSLRVIYHNNAISYTHFNIHYFCQVEGTSRHLFMMEISQHWQKEEDLTGNRHRNQYKKAGLYVYLDATDLKSICMEAVQT